MPLNQKCNVTAQTSYCTGAYGKMHVVLKPESNTTHWRVLCDIKKQKAGLYLALGYIPLAAFHSDPFQVLLIPLGN